MSRRRMFSATPSRLVPCVEQEPVLACRLCGRSPATEKPCSASSESRACPPSIPRMPGAAAAAPWRRAGPWSGMTRADVVHQGDHLNRVDRLPV